MAQAAGRLGAEDGWVRLQARMVLMRMGEPAVPCLLDALRSDNPLVRYEASAALSGMSGVSGEEAVRALTEGLGDPDPVVRSNCLLALRFIGRPAASAAPQVRAALYDESFFVRSLAPSTLAAIQEAEAGPAPPATLPRKPSQPPHPERIKR
jgi:HEAT repeat protein